MSRRLNFYVTPIKIKLEFNKLSDSGIPCLIVFNRIFPFMLAPSFANILSIETPAGITSW